MSVPFFVGIHAEVARGMEQSMPWGRLRAPGMSPEPEVRLPDYRAEQPGSGKAEIDEAVAERSNFDAQ